MISFHQLNNRLIPLDENIPLCSANAEREAIQWVQNQNMSAPEVVIIGMGAGYHIQEWLRQNPGSKVHVIDTRTALISAFQSLLKNDLERVEIIIVESTEALSRHEVMQSLCVNFIPVLYFQPAAGPSKSLFDSIFGFCTGRSPEGLKFYLKKLGFSNPEKIEVKKDGALLTIKDLGLIVDTTQPDHPKAPFIRVLKELVA